MARAWLPSAASVASVFGVLSDHDHSFIMVGKYSLPWMGVLVHTGYVLIAHPLMISCFLLLILP